VAKVSELIGYVGKWSKNQDQHPAWALKLSEAHGKGDEKTYTDWTVKVSKASGLDLAKFQPGDRVTVAGRSTTEVREYEGKSYKNLVLWADSIEKAEQKSAIPNNWVEVDDGAPF